MCINDRPPFEWRLCGFGELHATFLWCKCVLVAWFTSIFSLELCYVFPCYNFHQYMEKACQSLAYFSSRLIKGIRIKSCIIGYIYSILLWNRIWVVKSWKEYYEYPNECCRSVAKIRNGFSLGMYMKKLFLSSPLLPLLLLNRRSIPVKFTYQYLNVVHLNVVAFHLPFLQKCNMSAVLCFAKTNSKRWCLQSVWVRIISKLLYILKLPFNLLYRNMQFLNYFSGILIDCCNSALHYMHIWCHH